MCRNGNINTCFVTVKKYLDNVYGAVIGGSSMSIGSGHGRRLGRNGEFCITVGSVSRTWWHTSLIGLRCGMLNEPVICPK